MSNVFEEVKNKLGDSSILIWIFLASLGMLVIGVNHFVEDTMSSYWGIQELEAVYGIIPATYNLTYWTMSLSPQVGQVVFSYMFLTNTTKNRWAIYAAFGCLVIDFITDAFYRSGQNLFTGPTVFLVSVVFTLIYFTIGSEVFITIGLGLVTELFPSFIVQSKKLVERIFQAFKGKGGSNKAGNSPF